MIWDLGLLYKLWSFPLRLEALCVAGGGGGVALEENLDVRNNPKSYLKNKTEIMHLNDSIGWGEK